MSSYFTKEAKLIAVLLENSLKTMHTEVCEQCGKCSSACPVSKEIEGFNPRQIVTKIALGQIDEVLTDEAIWTCTTCLKCRERCPELISPYDIILVLRNLAYQQGLNYPAGYDDFINGILERGFISSPIKARTRDGGRVSRVSLGLPEPSSPLMMNVFKDIVEGMLKAGQTQ
jgi:heterodisulfide reductase subunit C